MLSSIASKNTIKENSMIARWLLLCSLLVIGCTGNRIENKLVQGEVTSKPIRWQASTVLHAQCSRVS